MQGEAMDDRPLFAITFRGAQICLGRTWEEIMATIETAQFDPKITASLKLCLYERLKERLRIQPQT
jgi:hypothetical protein